MILVRDLYLQRVSGIKIEAGASSNAYLCVAAEPLRRSTGSCAASSITILLYIQTGGLWNVLFFLGYDLCG
jgi:hypothetical protein